MQLKLLLIYMQSAINLLLLNVIKILISLIKLLLDVIFINVEKLELIIQKK